MWGAIWQVTLKLQREIGEVGGALYPFFWHISETVRAISPHMSRKVERKKDFEKNMLVWQDLTTITAFWDFVIDNGHLRSHIYTQRRWAGPRWCHATGGACVGVIKYKSIFLNTMYNNLHYGKVVQNPAWQTSVLVLNAPELAWIWHLQKKNQLLTHGNADPEV